MAIQYNERTYLLQIRVLCDMDETSLSDLIFLDGLYLDTLSSGFKYGGEPLRPGYGVRS